MLHNFKVFTIETNWFYNFVILKIIEKKESTDQLKVNNRIKWKYHRRSMLRVRTFSLFLPYFLPVTLRNYYYCLNPNTQLIQCTSNCYTRTTISHTSPAASSSSQAHGHCRSSCSIIHHSLDAHANDMQSELTIVRATYVKSYNDATRRMVQWPWNETEMSLIRDLTQKFSAQKELGNFHCFEKCSRVTALITWAILYS